MADKELSNLSIERKECPKCGALWINGEHYWSGTGKKGNELDLAGLVCNNYGNDDCINPCRYQEGGVTWQKRLTELDNDYPEDNPSN